MITRWGMSERLGLRVFGRKDEMIFLGKEISEERDYSEHIAEMIDEEVHTMVQEQYERAKNILVENRDKLDLVADRLLEVETLSREEFLVLMGDAPDDYDDIERPEITPNERDRDMLKNPPLDEGSDLPRMGTSPSPA
jgi:ATP-dependent Zn protease